MLKILERSINVLEYSESFTEVIAYILKIFFNVLAVSLNVPE